MLYRLITIVLGVKKKRDWFDKWMKHIKEWIRLNNIFEIYGMDKTQLMDKKDWMDEKYIEWKEHVECMKHPEWMKFIEWMLCMNEQDLDLAIDEILSPTVSSWVSRSLCMYKITG